MSEWNKAIQQMQSDAFKRAVETTAARLGVEPKDLPPGDYSHPRDHNGGPPLDDSDVIAMKTINDLYAEAKNFADGEPIASQEMHDEIERLFDGLGAAGKVAEELRVKEKKPHDDGAKAVQEKWNPYVQDKKGKVATARASLGELLAAWRKKVADEKARIAEEARKEADKLRAEAQAAIRASSGNLEAREVAEEKLELSNDAERFARRTEKKATTGTGLRTSYKAVMVDQEAALDWAWSWDSAAFEALVNELAQQAVRANVREIPGFRIDEVKTAI